MAPHNDASPSGSYTAGFNRFGTRTTAAAFATSNSASPLSSSFDSASAEAVVTDDHEQLFHSGPKRSLLPGVYVPTMCFFDPETEDVDTETIARHAVRLAQAGVMGLATQGSNGEAVHLTHTERRLVTKTTRVALNNAGFDRMPIVVGCGAQSTRETIQLCKGAYESGGDFALVLPPAYYAPLFKPAAQTVIEYFTAVADASPIPLLIYNFPGAVNGMDLSSDTVVQLAAHPNIVGVKLTCGNTGKLNRVATATRSLYPGKPGEPGFLVLGGSADFTVQTLAAGGHGILAGLANIAPRTCIRTMELFTKGNLSGAQSLQAVLSQGDWTAIQGGVVGVKAGMQAWSGYGGVARSPLPKPTEAEAAKWKEGFRDLVLMEKSL